MTSTESQRSTEVEPTSTETAEYLEEDKAREVAEELRKQGFEVYDTDVYHDACGTWVHVLDIDSHKCPASDF